MTTISRYTNGNCMVELSEDGTKTRMWVGDPKPEYPESIDLKITDHCDAGCPYCHEKSTLRGQHASTDFLLGLINDGLPQGAELAIGGGNPMNHPDLHDILIEARCAGLVSNLTINEEHFYYSVRLLSLFQLNRLVYGVGVSVKSLSRLPLPGQATLNNLVWHTIVGVGNPQSILTYPAERVLVLGYKDFGFGTKYHTQRIDDNMQRWRFWMNAILARVLYVSFDNLALKQLDIRNRVSKDVWDSSYMGDDGKFTMYIDAVKQEYAASSTSPRRPCGSMSVKEMFGDLQNE